MSQAQAVEARSRPRPRGGRADREPVELTLSLPVEVRLSVSPEDFRRLCLLNRDLRLERTTQGELEAMPPTSGGTGAKNGRLTMQVVHWALNDGTGTGFDSSTGFTLPNGAIRSPDASWIRNTVWHALTEEQRDTGFAPVCPDFVIELRSPSDDLNKLESKMDEYISQGVRLGWLIDAGSKTVAIYRPGRPVERLDKPATLSGEDVLPGFVLDLKGILFD